MVVAFVAVVTSVLSGAVNHAIVFGDFAPAVVVGASEVIDFVIVLYKGHVAANIEVSSAILGQLL